MTRQQLLDKFDIVYRNYRFRRNGRTKNKYYPILLELQQKWFNPWFVNFESFLLEIPSKIKFSGLKVTRYTREYGKTIVHFEPISES